MISEIYRSTTYFSTNVLFDISAFCCIRQIERVCMLSLRGGVQTFKLLGVEYYYLQLPQWTICSYNYLPEPLSVNKFFIRNMFVFFSFGDGSSLLLCTVHLFWEICGIFVKCAQESFLAWIAIIWKCNVWKATTAHLKMSANFLLNEKLIKYADFIIIHYTSYWTFIQTTYLLFWLNLKSSCLKLEKRCNSWGNSDWN